MHFISVCQLGVDLAANALEATTASQVSCYLPTLCTAVDCCVDVPAISTSFNAHVEIDPCKYMLRVGIDKFSFNKSLDRYTFGETHLDWKKNCKTLRLKSFTKKFFKASSLWMVTYKKKMTLICWWYFFFRNWWNVLYGRNT